jgi:hypothetical protein
VPITIIVAIIKGVCFLNKRSTSASLGYIADTKVFLYYIMQIIYIETVPLNHAAYEKKSHENPLGSFKDLSIHRDRQREVTLLYTML